CHERAVRHFQHQRLHADGPGPHLLRIHFIDCVELLPITALGHLRLRTAGLARAPAAVLTGAALFASAARTTCIAAASAASAAVGVTASTGVGHFAAAARVFLTGIGAAARATAGFASVLSSVLLASIFGVAVVTAAVVGAVVSRRAVLGFAGAAA